MQNGKRKKHVFSAVCHSVLLIIKDGRAESDRFTCFFTFACLCVAGQELVCDYMLGL